MSRDWTTIISWITLIKKQGWVSKDLTKVKVYENEYEIVRKQRTSYKSSSILDNNGIEEDMKVECYKISVWMKTKKGNVFSILWYLLILYQLILGISYSRLFISRRLVILRIDKKL